MRRLLLATFVVLISITTVVLLVVLEPGTGARRVANRPVSAVGTVDLGSAGNFNDSATQAPDDDVYFVGGAHDAKVFVVRGLKIPLPILTENAPVLALLATSTDLYLTTANTIHEFALPSDQPLGAWPLPARLLPFGTTPNEAGLTLEGNHLWVWVSLYSDTGGWEPGSLVLYNTSTWTAKVINRNDLDPFYVASGPEGFYYNSPETRVVLSRPNGRLVSSPLDAGDFNLMNPIAVMDGQVDVDTTDRSAQVDTLHSFDVLTLHARRPVHLSAPITSLLATPWGLAALSPTGAVVFIDRGTGQEHLALIVPGAWALLLGSHLSVLALRGNDLDLVRLD